MNYSEYKTYIWTPWKKGLSIISNTCTSKYYIQYSELQKVFMISGPPRKKGSQ